MRTIAGIVLACALAGCADGGGRFPLVVSTLADDDQPLPGLAVFVDGVAVGKTGADGKLLLRLAGKEGARVRISVDTPTGYRAAVPAHDAVLRRLSDIEGHGRAPLPVEHVLRFAPLSREYAVLVRTGTPGLPVEVFGSRRAVTNDEGVAMFLYAGTPGDDLQVRVVTDGRPELQPQNPVQSFQLAPTAEAYLVKQRFTSAKLEPRRRRIGQRGPKRL
jgi:hypothetical protein